MLYFFFYNNVIYGYDDNGDSRMYILNEYGSITEGYSGNIYIKQIPENEDDIMNMISAE